MSYKTMSIIKRAIIAVLMMALLTCVCTLTGCGLFEDDEPANKNIELGTTYERGKADTSVIASVLGDGAVRNKKTKIKGSGKDTFTILVYMNGSNLETDDGEATEDLTEMVKAGSSNKVNIVVQTMGTKKWSSKYGIAADHSQRYEVNGDGLKLVDDSLGQLDCTAAGTLGDFITWGVKNYQADRYALVFWDHGGGPVYGFGYDEWNSDETACLTVAEMKEGLTKAGVYFDFIGMDCCIMSCLETALAFYDFCDYAVLSEEFESGLGWYYTDWIKAIIENTSIATTKIGKKIVKGTVNANVKDSSEGDSAAMAIIDESMMKVLYTAWTDFAYENESELLGTNYSRKVTRSKRALPPSRMKGFWDDFDYYDEDSDTYALSDYYISDMLSLAENIDSDKSDTLRAAVANTICYSQTTSDDSDMCGIAVTLPYGDSDFYDDMKNVFLSIGMDEDYVEWLEKFTDAEGNSSYYDYDDYDGWDDYDDDDYDWSDWDLSDDYWDDDSWDDWDWCDNLDEYWYDGSDYCDDYWDDYYYDDSDYDDSSDDWYYDDDDDWYYDDDDYGYDDWYDDDDWY